MALAPEKCLQMKKSMTKKKGVKINFHRVLLGFFENWDKSPQKKWDKGAECGSFKMRTKNGIISVNNGTGAAFCG